MFTLTVGSQYGRWEQETAAAPGKPGMCINMNSGSYKLVACSSSSKTPNSKKFKDMKNGG